MPSPLSCPLSCPRRAPPLGWTLPELLTCLGLLGVWLAIALPDWQQWHARSQVQGARELLVMDLQGARIHALQRAQALKLQALTSCAWHSRAATDWSCGWELVTTEGNERLQTTPLHAPLGVTFTKSVALPISASGEVGQVGERWTFLWPRTSGPGAGAAQAQSVCLSAGGRVRWVASPTCS